MSPRKDKTPSPKKDKYHIHNWQEYNASLVNRGSITFWFGDEVIEKWYSKEKMGKPGRPDTYSDDAIRCALMIKAGIWHEKDEKKLTLHQSRFTVPFFLIRTLYF